MSFNRRSIEIAGFRQKIGRYSRSLRFRLFLILLFISIVPTAVLKYGILRNYESQSVDQRVSLIRSRAQMITPLLEETKYLQGEESDEIDTQLVQLADLWNGRVVVINRNFRILRDTFSLDEGKVIIAEEVLRSFGGEPTSNYNRGARFLEVTVPVHPSGDEKEVDGLLIISAPTDEIVEGKGKLSSTVLILQGILILFSALAAFYASRLLVRPFSKVTASFEARGGFLEEDISMPDYTETETLAAAYNRMRQRLNAQEESRQEFVSNVSHEVKTPLASMKVLADSLLAQEEVPNELYRDFMNDITEEVDRETKIVNDLLSLVKMDRTAADLQIQETNMNDLIELILKRLRPIAAKQNIDLVQESSKTVIAEIDQTKMTLAITNLVENAIKYNRPDGWVRVSLNMDNSFFFLKVEDSGMGIPEEAQQFIFERFYRVDKSHSREIGGTGLGLAITKQAVLMHHGAIRVYSREGEGTTFTVRVPLHYISEEE